MSNQESLRSEPWSKEKDKGKSGEWKKISVKEHKRKKKGGKRKCVPVGAYLRRDGKEDE